MRPPRLIVLGHAAHDLVYRVPRIPTRPVKVVATAMSECGGGMAANAAVAAARLGGNVSYWGRVADDSIGARILDDLAKEGVDVRCARRIPGCRSPVSSILVDDAGERLICSFTDPGLDPDPAWLPLDEVGNADAVLADVRWPAGSVALLGAARQAGRPALLDADVAPSTTIHDLVACASYVLFSEPGLEAARPGLATGAALQSLRLDTHRVIGVTLGAEGFLWLEGGDERRVAAPPIQAVDTLAAGDVWHGAFALAIGEGRDTGDAVRFANDAAALKCLRPGGRSGAPTRAELDAWRRP